MVVLEARGLSKMFSKQGRPAVDRVDLSLASGRVLAVLGANGAGKTTLLRMLTTLTTPTAGSATVCGFDVRDESVRVRERIGLVGQYAALDEVLSGRANVVMFARLLGLSKDQARARAGELIEDFGLAADADRPVGQYSGGMRRRIDLAVALVTRPQVLFIDEPSVGLDPLARRALWERVRDLVGGGTSVVLTTQYLEEADALADDVVILAGGKVLLSGTAQELTRLAGEPRVEVRQPTLEDLYLQLHATSSSRQATP